jgi:hypothetical protein
MKASRITFGGWAGGELAAVAGLAVFALVALGNAPEARGQVGWDRSGRGASDGGGPESDCQRQAQPLRDINTALLKAWALAVSNGDKALQASILARYRYNALRWEMLKASHCPNIGDLPTVDENSPTPITPPDPALPPEPPSNSDKDYYKSMASKVANDQRTANIGTAEAVGILSVPGQPLPVQVATWLGRAGLTVAAAQWSADSAALADSWNGLAADPPAPDYDHVELARLESVTVPADATQQEKILWNLVKARRSETACVKAFTTSLERYHGAKQSKDVLATQRQAAAMVHNAGLALESARAAAEKQAEFDRELLTALDAVEAAMKDKGMGWEQTLANYRKNAGAEPLPAALRGALTDAKVPAAQIDALGNSMQKLTAKDIQAQIAALHTRVTETELVRKELSALHSKASWPPAPDVLGLQVMISSAARMSREADADVPDASSHSAVQPAPR